MTEKIVEVEKSENGLLRMPYVSLRQVNIMRAAEGSSLDPKQLSLQLNLSSSFYVISFKKLATRYSPNRSHLADNVSSMAIHLEHTARACGIYTVMTSRPSGGHVTSCHMISCQRAADFRSGANGSCSAPSTSDEPKAARCYARPVASLRGAPVVTRRDER